MRAEPRQDLGSAPTPEGSTPLYRTIVADPPWEMPRGGRNSGGVNPNSERWGRNQNRTGTTPGTLPYPTMSISEIEALPIASLSDQGAHLYLWVPNRHIESAYGVARAWGFRPSVLLTWCKQPRGINLGGTFTQTSEFILFCRRGTLRSKVRVDTTWWKWTRPHNKHSAKPESFLDLVESVSPGPYVELFARRARLGWDYWGNESLGTIEIDTRLPALARMTDAELREQVDAFCDEDVGGQR